MLQRTTNIGNDGRSRPRHASAHARSVLDAYGWPHDLSDGELLERLLALNLGRAAG